MWHPVAIIFWTPPDWKFTLSLDFLGAGLTVTENMNQRIYPLLFAALLFFQSSYLNAAACCTSATAFGVGRLLMWEQFAVGTRLSVRSDLGFFDGNTNFYSTSKTAGEARTDLYGLFPLSKSTSTFFQIPWGTPWEIGAGEKKWASGMGDIQFGIRHQAVAIGEYVELPGVAVMASVTMPTGKSPGSGSMATGRGDFALFVGAALEKTFSSIWFTQLNLSGRAPLPQNSTQHGKYWSGLGLDIGLVGGVELITDLVASVSGQFTGESSQYIDGSLHENSGRYKCNSAMALAWRFDPHWTLLASASSDIFIAGLGKHYPAVISGGLGIRYGYF